MGKMHDMSIDKLKKVSDPIHPLEYPTPHDGTEDEDKFPTVSDTGMGMHSPEDEDGEIEGLAWSDYRDSPLIRRGNPDADNYGEGPFPEDAEEPESEDGEHYSAEVGGGGATLTPRQKSSSSYRKGP